MRPGIEEPGPLVGLDTPLPPSELRGRTLGVAGEALGREPTPDVWSRLWFSRPLRVAWGLSVAASIAGHLGMTMASSSDSPEDPTMFVSSASTDQSDLQEIINLPWVDQTVLRDAVFTNDRIDDRDQKENAS